MVETVKVTGLPPAEMLDALKSAVMPCTVPALTPTGEPTTVVVKLVAALKPFKALTAIELLWGAPPGMSGKLLGEADNAKLGFVEVGARALSRLCPFGLPQPVTRS